MSQSASWTIMVYISADDVLANFAIESLKQLRDAAGDGIVVLAQFYANQRGGARVYRFDGKGSKERSVSIETCRIPNKKLRGLPSIHKPDMTNPVTLTQFINYATDNSKTDHYCLILWGHGTELLLDENRRFASPKQSGNEATNAPPTRYLTYSNLKKALQDTKLVNGSLEGDLSKSKDDAKRPKSNGRKQTFDILGIDACSMCMVEVAAAVKDYVDYMVASQEDVPDASFPYEKILSGLKGDEIRDDVRKITQMIPILYRQAFRDYIASPATGVKEITLASLDLSKIRTVTEPLTRLASALLNARNDNSLCDKIISARSQSQGYVFGIFVDLYDFCQRLELALDSRRDAALASSCKAICEAIKLHEDGCIVENQPKVKKNPSHGLSIYFPYRTENKTEDVEEALAKGGTRQPLKGGTRQPLKERSARIEELEADFAKLEKFRETGWEDFIKHGWSLMLANETRVKLNECYAGEKGNKDRLKLDKNHAPEQANNGRFELDKYYSAEQVAANLSSLRERRTAAKAA